VCRTDASHLVSIHTVALQVYAGHGLSVIMHIAFSGRYISAPSSRINAAWWTVALHAFCVATKMHAGHAGVVVLTNDTFSAQVLQSRGPVLVDFFAPWCRLPWVH
jgi:hypothetical protein